MLDFFKKNYKIGLDLDEVCVDFLTGYAKEFNMPLEDIKHFYFSYNTWNNLEELHDDHEWWINLEAKVKGDTLPFLPVGYVSNRSFPTSVSERWLEKNKFPCMPVIHVTNSKLAACQELGINVYIDDHIKNFQELMAGGITCFLMDCQHNQNYDVGEYRIKSLHEVPQKLISMGL